MAIVTCPNCGAKNRIDERSARTMQPVCGKCKTKLPLDGDRAANTSHPIEVTDETFQKEVLAADRPVLVDFWAAWCGPCRMLAPTIEQLAKESNGRYRVAKIDIDENIQTAGRYTISSIPTVMIFKNGQMVEKMEGLQSKQAIQARLARLS